MKCRNYMETFLLGALLSVGVLLVCCSSESNKGELDVGRGRDVAALDSSGDNTEPDALTDVQNWDTDVGREESFDDAVGSFCGDGICGPDEHCATCPEDCGCEECGEECVEGVCTFTACAGKECGDDGCGGTCGSCADHYECRDGHCVYEPWCGDGICSPDEDCATCPEDCGCEECGEECVEGVCTFTACAGKECGDDGCGGVCGECDDGQACFPDRRCISTSWTDPESGLTWTRFSARVFSGELDLACTRGGWRLPTITELRTLVRGCPAAESGGSCNIEDGGCVDPDCRDRSCWEGCPPDEGPADGCYWPEELSMSEPWSELYPRSECGFYWSSTHTQPTEWTEEMPVWFLDFRDASFGLLPTEPELESSSAHLRCVIGPN